VNLSKISALATPNAVGVLQCFDDKPIDSDPVTIGPSAHTALDPDLIHLYSLDVVQARLHPGRVEQLARTPVQRGLDTRSKQIEL
jgi:hypothetical protein